MKKIMKIRNDYDNCVYHKKILDGLFICLLLYVDDMLIVAKNVYKINKLRFNLVVNLK